MKLKLTNAFKQAAGLGIIAGMRTFAAPIVLSHVYSRHPAKQLKSTSFSLLQNTPTSKVLKVLGAAELIGDKLPFAPNRTSIGGLTGRFVSGALCGAAVYKANRQKPLLGGLIGGVAAIGSAFGCMFLRLSFGKKTKIPDAAIGLMEDVIVIYTGTVLAKQL